MNKKKVMQCLSKISIIEWLPQTHLYIAQPEEKTVTEAEGNLSSDLWEAPICSRVRLVNGILEFPLFSSIDQNHMKSLKKPKG